jgi:hypothetical protein
MQRSMMCLVSIVGSVLVLLCSCNIEKNPASVVGKRLLLTEIMANQGGTETGGAGEFIELINAGESTVDLHNMWIAVGTQDAPAYDQLQSFRIGTTMLLPGAYAVIVDPNYDDRYSFPTGTVLVTVGDAAFGSGGIATTHRVTLYDVALYDLGASNQLDQFLCPSDPGDGVSLYRISLKAPDNSANWAASPSNASPGKAYDPNSCCVNTFVSFWADRHTDDKSRSWVQAIGWPYWYDTLNGADIVSADGESLFTYRYNIPAPQAFEFTNPYTDYEVIFEDRNSPTDTGLGTETKIRISPNVTTLVPASSLGYYYAYTEGPVINTQWSDEDPSLLFSTPPDGILAPFFVEIPVY